MLCELFKVSITLSLVCVGAQSEKLPETPQVFLKPSPSNNSEINMGHRFLHFDIHKLFKVSISLSPVSKRLHLPISSSIPNTVFTIMLLVSTLDPTMRPQLMSVTLLGTLWLFSSKKFQNVNIAVYIQSNLFEIYEFMGIQSRRANKIFVSRRAPALK